MDALRLDVWLAFRCLRKSPTITALAVFTLALGIGASGSIFALADTILFRPLGLPDADRVVHVYQRRADGPTQAYPLSLADYFDYRATSQSFSSLAAHYPTSPMYVAVGDDAVSVTGAVVTASYFDVIALPPTTGRFFTAEEDRVRGRDAVAVISEGFWRRHFAGEARALGSAIRVNGRDFTVIGVGPRGFVGVHAGGSVTDVWIPSAMFEVGYRYCDGFARSCTVVEMLGRLRSGVAIDQAQRELDALAANLASAYPATNKGVGVWIASARGRGYGAIADDSRQMTLFVTSAAVVLLIVCANIAGLLFARLAARRKEIAMRFALGATRPRIARQLLTESLLIAAAGAGAGLIVSAWGNSLLHTMYAQDGAGRPLNFQLTMSTLVVTATVAVSLVAALVFGILPAMQATRTDVNAVLKDEITTSAARAWLRQVLVATQIALSVALLVGAGLVLQSARNLSAGPGFDPGPLLTLRLRPSLVGYSRQRSHEYQRRVIQQIEAVPGVVSASPAVFLTLVGGGMRVRVASESAADGEFEANGGHGGAHYFKTLGLSMIEGRDFSEQDDSRTPPVVIVNDVLAKRQWPGVPATGQTVVLDGKPFTVIGVVRDAQYYVTGEAPRPQAFFSYWQPPDDDAFLNDARVTVRVSGDSAAMLAPIRRAVSAVDASVPISEDHPLRERVKYSYQSVRTAQVLLASFAVLALVLTAVGLYGTLAFSVTQRTREIGIRLALGARRGDIAALVLRHSAAITAAGVALGVAVAWGASQRTANLLYGVESHDPAVFIGAPLVLAAVAFAAAIVPMRRAVRVSALTVVRYE